MGAQNDDTPFGANAGSAYLFVRNGGGWAEQAQLSPSSGAAGDLFGDSLAVDGDTAVVGAMGYGLPGAHNCGAAFVFVRIEGVWTEQARLSAPDPELGDLFGRSVAISGDTIVVGASSDDTPAGENAGSACVFVRTDGVWTLQTQLVASDATASEFGYAVALTDDSLIVGARGGVSGSAFIFRRVGGLWTEHDQIQAADGIASGFGASVAIDGDAVIIGATCADQYEGAAYIFENDGSNWTQQANLIASDDVTGEMFGQTVAIDGDRAIVGSRFGGSVFVYQRVGGAWTQHARLRPHDHIINEYFGYSVALESEVAIIGAYGADAPGGMDAGFAYTFDFQNLFAACDVNCDGSTNAFDIQPFLEGLMGSRFPCSTCAGDADANGTVNAFDINGFIDCLSF